MCWSQAASYGTASALKAGGSAPQVWKDVVAIEPLQLLTCVHVSVIVCVETEYFSLPQSVTLRFCGGRDSPINRKGIYFSSVQSAGL